MDPRTLSGQAYRPPRCRRRRCLLKDCGQWFQPTHPQCRYCSAACREAARRWRRWHAQQTYRASDHGREHRQQQARRYRRRCQERPSPAAALAAGAGAAAACSRSDGLTCVGKHQPTKCQKVRIVLATGQAVTCCLPGMRRARGGISVVPCAARRCVASWSVKRGGGNGVAVVCSQRDGGDGRGHAARNDVFPSSRQRPQSLISPGLLRGRGRNGWRPRWRCPFPSSITVGQGKKSAMQAVRHHGPAWRCARSRWHAWANAIAAIVWRMPTPRRPWRSRWRSWGQLAPVVVCRREEQWQVVDGFKRLAAARALDWPSLLVRRLETDDERTVKAAVYGLNRVGQHLQELEEAWLVQALVREDGLSQVATAELLGRHKSWVCRRLALLEKLSAEVRRLLIAG